MEKDFFNSKTNKQSTLMTKKYATINFMMINRHYIN